MNEEQVFQTPQPQYQETEPQGKGFFRLNILKLLLGFFFLFAIILVLFLFVLPNLSKKDQKVNLVWWGVTEDVSTMQSTITDFQKLNPNITIEYKKQDIKDYKERLLTRIKNSTGPDIFAFHNTWYPMLSGVLLPLPSEAVTKSEFNNSFYPVVRRDLVKNGAIYGIPVGIDTLSLFTNSDLLKQAGLSTPTNWNDFIATARTLTVKDQNGKIKTAGAALGTFDNVVNAPDIISLLFAQDGANLSDLSQTKQKVSDSLTFYTSFSLGDGSVWDATLDNSLTLFSKGSLAMYFGYYWDYFAIKQTSSPLSFQVVPVPQLASQNTNIASYYPFGLSARGTHQKEALLFMKFLSQRDVQDKIYAEEAKVRTYGQPPSRTDSLVTLKNTPVSTFSEQAKSAASSYFSDRTFDNGINSQMNSLLRSAVNNINNNTSVDNATEALVSQFSQVLTSFISLKK